MKPKPKKRTWKAWAVVDAVRYKKPTIIDMQPTRKLAQLWGKPELEWFNLEVIRVEVREL